jgi:hypothetical protein
MLLDMSNLITLVLFFILYFERKKNKITENNLLYCHNQSIVGIK